MPEKKVPRKPWPPVDSKGRWVHGEYRLFYGSLPPNTKLTVRPWRLSPDEAAQKKGPK